MENNRIEQNRMEWNGMEWNGIEQNRIEQNRILRGGQNRIVTDETRVKQNRQRSTIEENRKEYGVAQNDEEKNTCYCTRNCQ